MESSTQQDFMATGEQAHRLAEQPHQYSAQLEAIRAKQYQTSDDEIEAARLKKMKLRLKDQMEARAHHTSAPLSVA